MGLVFNLILHLEPFHSLFSYHKGFGCTRLLQALISLLVAKRKEKMPTDKETNFFLSTVLCVFGAGHNLPFGEPQHLAFLHRRHFLALKVPIPGSAGSGLNVAFSLPLDKLLAGECKVRKNCEWKVCLMTPLFGSTAWCECGVKMPFYLWVEDEEVLSSDFSCHFVEHPFKDKPFHFTN